MIRAASTLRIVGGSPSALAFQLTSQMTSLTGCSGEGFVSILKALGFESVTVRRSEIVWPAPAAPVAAPAETVSASGEATAPSEEATPALEATTATSEETSTADGAEHEKADGAHDDSPNELAL